MDGLKLDGAAVGATPYVIIDSGMSFLAGPTTDAESIACPLSSSTTIPSRQERTFDCTATYNVAYTVGGVNYEIIVKDLAISFSSGAPLRSNGDRTFQQFVEKSWILVDVFMRNCRVKFDVKESIEALLEVRRSTGSRVREMTRQVDVHAEPSSNGSWRSRPALELIRVLIKCLLGMTSGKGDRP